MDQLMNLLPMIAIYAGFFGLLWFFLVRPQKKKQEQVQKMRDELKAGDEIVTIGGIVGKVVKVKEDYVHLEVIKGANHMVVTKWAIGEITHSKALSKKELETKNIKETEQEMVGEDQIIVKE